MTQSRSVWIAASLVGAICAAAFIYALIVNRDATPSPRGLERYHDVERTTHDRGVADRPRFGFVAGVVVGGIAGIALGVVIGRRRHVPDRDADHSARNRP